MRRSTFAKKGFVEIRQVGAFYRLLYILNAFGSILRTAQRRRISYTYACGFPKNRLFADPHPCRASRELARFGDAPPDLVKFGDIPIQSGGYLFWRAASLRRDA